MLRLGAALAAGLWLAFGASWAACADAPSAPLVGDPAIRRGMLANGLRYAIMPNATPAGGLSLRLAFDVGSFDETEAERGAAHFVEHMAFRATRRFPEGTLEPAFAAMGVAAGYDQNALTARRATEYQLDLPQGGHDQRALAFAWLRGVADAIVFDPAAVERERGVVIAERSATTDPGGLVEDQVDAFHGPELRSVQRPVIGDLAVLRTITPAALAAFHARWYRPERAVLVIVGDIPPAGLAGLEREIADVFGDWRGQGPSPVRPPTRGPDLARGLDAFVLGEPQVAGGLTICRVRAAEPDRLADMAEFRPRALRLVWSAILQARLDQLRLVDASILSADVLIEDDEPDVSKICLSASAATADWEGAMKALQVEARRFSADGPSEPELDAAMIKVRGGFIGEASKAATRGSADLASTLAYNELIGQTTQAPRQLVKAFNQAVEAITPALVADAWRADWSGAGPFVAVVGAEPPSRQQVLAAWTANEAGKAEAYVKHEASRWAYGTIGAPGKVVVREVLTEPDFVRLRFENGLVLNFKQTAFAKGQVEVRIDFGAGRGALAGRSTTEGLIATEAFVAGGLGRHTYGELRAMFGDEPLSFELTMDHRAFTLSATAFPERLPEQLLLMATYLTDPGFRGDQDAKLPQELANTRRAQAAAPASLLFEQVMAVTGLPTPPVDQLARLTSRDFAAWLAPIVTKAPLEATLVGDIDEATAIELVAATFGALPPRTAQSAPAGGGYGRFPAQTPGRIALTHAGPADKAMVMAVWPLFVAEPARRREEGASFCFRCCSRTSCATWCASAWARPTRPP